MNIGLRAAPLEGTLFRTQNPHWQPALFLGAHIPLALLLRQVSALATIHALVTLVVALWFAVQPQRRMERVTYAIAYICGAEVLWRMCKAAIFWEFGKYATIVLIIVALVGERKWKLSAPAFWYFVLLLPSIWMTSSVFDLGGTEQGLSSNLSGPLALAACVVFFSNVKLSRTVLLQGFMALVGPVVSIGTVAFWGIITNPRLAFDVHSNFATSGGFGPNQVSSILGLGALLAFIYALSAETSMISRAIMAGACVLLTVQSALTFSRSGVYLVIIGAAAFLLFFISNARARLYALVVVGFIALVANFYILPRLEQFTDGAITARFQNTSLDGRDLIAQTDLATWATSPLFGVGPGVSPATRNLSSDYLISIAPHTEYTRLLAEHGALGLLAIILLAFMSLQALLRARSSFNRAIVVSLLSWALVYMTVNGMRLVAPSLVFGLAFVYLLDPLRKAPAGATPVGELAREGRPEAVLLTGERVHGATK